MQPDKFEEFCREINAAKKQRSCVCVYSYRLTDKQLVTLRSKYFVTKVPYQQKMWMIC